LVSYAQEQLWLWGSSDDLSSKLKIQN